MKKLLLFLMVPVMTALTACQEWIYEYPGQQDGQEGVSLLMHVSSVNGNTRALSPDGFEKITTLRIILLDEEGRVEANRYFADVSDYDFSNPDGSYDFVITRLTPGRKTVYIVANEEGTHGIHYSKGDEVESARCLGDVLDSAEKGETGFGELLESVWFDGFYPTMGNMPYSARHEVILGAGSENYKSFYIVPAATKFTLNFWNYRRTDVSVNSMSISSLANRSYIMPHVGSSDMYKDYVPETGPREPGLYWIDWLAKVAKASWATDGDFDGNVDFNSRYGWILDYTIPAGTNHQPITISGLPVMHPVAEDSNSPSYSEILYLSESAFGALPGQRQKYTMTFDIKGGEYVKDKEYELTNINALFRDTHVKINIYLRDSEFEIDVDVDRDPWDEDELNPEFGTRVWSGGTDVDPWDEDQLNPEYGHGHNGFTDNDPWDENQSNPGYGGGTSGSTDNDPWDENQSNPGYGGGTSGSSDNDPWDENQSNPSYGGGTSGSTDNDPWDENQSNPGYGGGTSGSTDNDPWDEDQLNPGFGNHENSGSTDNDPWDERPLNPSFK